MAEITTARSGNVLVPYVDAKKITKQVPLTVAGTNWTTIRAQGLAYADSNGVWRVRFNIEGNLSSDQGSNIISINGVIFKQGVYQGVYASAQDAAGNLRSVYTDTGSNSSDINIGTVANTYKFLWLSGDVELESKPTWADANLEDVTAVDMFIAENSLPGSKLLDASIPMSKLASMYEPRNFMINGALDFWQRGTSFSSAGYSADRFYTTANGSVTISQSTTYLPDSNTLKSLRWVTGASSSYTAISQSMEQDNVMLLRGKYVTFSADVMTRGTAFASTFWVGSYYSNSSDARASLTTPIGDVGISPAASGVWKRITYTFLVPTDAVGLAVAIDCNSVQASGVEVYTSNWMLNIGSVAAPFQRAGGTIGGELALCQRYYEKSYDLTDAPGVATDGGCASLFGSTSGSGNIGVDVKFKITKRASPTIKYWADNGTADRWAVYASGVATTFEVASGRKGTSGFLASMSSVASAWVPANTYGNWTADAEL